MSTEGRTLMYVARVPGLNDGDYLRSKNGNGMPTPGDVVEAWVDGRGPKVVIVGLEVHRNKRWVYFNYVSKIET